MDLVAVIRHKVHAEGVPLREVARELGLSRNTIRRYARAKRVPIDRSSLPTRSTPARDAIEEAAESIWQSRRSFTAGKQQLTATRLWELLREAGHTASERTVRRLVAEFRSAERRSPCRSCTAPGELAQVDFFEVWVDLAGVRQKAWLFLMRLMFSGRDFAMLCAQQDTTWFLAAHVAAFTHFAGVVAAVTYDNLTAAVGKVLVGAPRVLRPRRSARGALRVRASILPARRGARQGWRRASRRTHSMAAPGAAAARTFARGDERGAPGTPRRAARQGPVASRVVVTRARSAASSPAAFRWPARSRRQTPSPRHHGHRRRHLLWSRADGADRPSTCSSASTRSPSRSATRPYPIGELRLVVVVLTIAICYCRFRANRKRFGRSLRSSSHNSVIRGRLSGTRSAPCTRPMRSRPPGALAPWLERADREGVGRLLARAIDLAIADGSLVTAPRRSSRPGRTDALSPRRSRSIPSKRPT